MPAAADISAKRARSWFAPAAIGVDPPLRIEAAGDGPVDPVRISQLLTCIDLPGKAAMCCFESGASILVEFESTPQRWIGNGLA